VELIETVGEGPVALDSAIFIYFMERHPKYLPIVKPVFERIDRGELPAMTSSLTLMETLVVPYRSGDRELAQLYEEILTAGQGLKLVPIDLSVVRLAAKLRAAARVRTPDALQLAAALIGGSNAFVTNDNRLPQVPGLRVLSLDSFV
jgi:predicted nucleic acid-binding protein